MKIWIAGAAGQLGCALNDMAKQYQPDAEIINTDIEEVDVTNLNQVIDFAKGKRPDVIFDCAAVTNVGTCEESPEYALSLIHI